MDKIEKFLNHLNKKEKLIIRQILADIKILNLNNHDTKPLRGLKGVFRLRKGRIRIEFMKETSRGHILSVMFRKDAYKN